MTEPATPTDPLAELRAQLRATTEAAARLASETAQARAQAIPPAGWATPAETEERRQELQALVALVEALRELVPAELQLQVRDVLRQVLLLLRSVIDWWVERMGSGAGPGVAGAPSVQETPID